MLKNGVEKNASDIIEYPFFIRYLSARNYWLHDYAYNTMFFWYQHEYHVVFF